MSAKALLGHSNLRHTEKYMHVCAADLAGAVDALVRKTAEIGTPTTQGTTQEAAGS